MAKRRTEEALQVALADRTEKLTNAAAEAIFKAAHCSKSTFYKSAAFKAFEARLMGPAPRATKGTKETMTSLRGTVKLLSNCVQALSVRLEQQEKELVALRERAGANVVSFPIDKRAARNGGAP